MSRCRTVCLCVCTAFTRTQSGVLQKYLPPADTHFFTPQIGGNCDVIESGLNVSLLEQGYIIETTPNVISDELNVAPLCSSRSPCSAAHQRSRVYTGLFAAFLTMVGVLLDTGRMQVTGCIKSCPFDAWRGMGGGVAMKRSPLGLSKKPSRVDHW